MIEHDKYAVILSILENNKENEKIIIFSSCCCAMRGLCIFCDLYFYLYFKKKIYIKHSPILFTWLILFQQIKNTGFL